LAKFVFWQDLKEGSSRSKKVNVVISNLPSLQLSSPHPPSHLKKARSYMTWAMKNKVSITRIFLRDTGQWYFHIILEIIIEWIA
jgi:tRNA1(Val) A37 N6-methylase TrmN6